MILLGMLIVIAAVIVSVGIVSMSENSEQTETLVLFGYGFDLTIAEIFLWGAAIGALALFGLAMVLGRASGIAHRRREYRHELRQTRREAKMARKERDELLEEQRKHAYDTPAAAPAVAPTSRQEPVVEYETISSPPQRAADPTGTATTSDVRGDAPTTGTAPERFTQRRRHSGFWSRIFGHRSETVDRR